MCGIAGAINLAQINVEDMLAAIQHRGPDHQGIYRQNDCVLAMNRLAIIGHFQAWQSADDTLRWRRGNRL